MANKNKNEFSSNLIDFEPSQSTKKLWLSTRKIGKPVSDKLSLPGLFETRDYKQDRTLFFIAIILEVIGFVLMSSLANWGILIAGTVAGSILIDIFLAVLLHWNQSQICMRLNFALAQNNEGHLIKAQKLKHSFGRTLWTILLCVLAIGKAFVFYALNTETYIFGIVMLLVYVFVAYVHIRHTGYCFAGWRHKTSENNEKNRFLNNKTSLSAEEKTKYPIRDIEVANYRTHDLENPDKLELEEKTLLKEGKEKAIVVKDNNQWKLRTWGILLDEDLNNLIQMFSTEKVREYIAKEGVATQLVILTKNANEL